MEQMIKTLHIRNYKSIKELDLYGCERINVFVGDPNTGKSNILEALDLSYLSEMLGMNESILKWNERNPDDKKEIIDLKKFFRLDNIVSLFNSGNIRKPLYVASPEVSYCNYSLEYKTDSPAKKNYFRWHAAGTTDFDNDFNKIDKNQSSYGSPIVPFRYKNDMQFHDIGNYHYNLMPPFGNNLADVIYHDSNLRKIAVDFAYEYGFELVINLVKHEISFQEKLNDGIIYQIPFKAFADTFKRMLFHIAAVKDNNASVITLDEPDTHAFPNYVSLLADEIIEQKKNQFFITTHNPYLFGELIEQTPKGDLAVFVCGFDKSKKSTYAKKLTDEDLSELLDYGVDIFFNLNRYLNDGIEYSA